LLGLVLAWRRRGWPRLAIWFVAGYSASVVAFFVFSRFRMPMMPALYVLAAHAVVEIVRCLGRARVDRTRRARAALLVAGWLALVAFVHLPLRGRADSLAAALAGASGLPFRLETSATARFNLGVVYAARAADAADASAWLRRAEEQLRLAWAEEPRFASIPIELGKVLARQRREAEAVEVYRAALALEPGNHRIHHALGLLAERMADEQAAETAFRRALELEPRHVASAVHLGESLLRQGRVEEARAAFAHAARLAPENERARSGLRRSREGR
ncbi:MAG TPA: tetratricopeptide repeat protein, partial [Candidatus Polarisedimenticolaceae bacterium]|nr:tetratricopeptide repeat protein [Candidatus Polarisedimenticolaceae bacterium]